MTKEINELNQELGKLFITMLPSAYSRACMFYRGNPGSEPEFRFCYVDAASGTLIPDDHICERTDITVEDPAALDECRKQIIEKAQKLQKTYLDQLEDKWYTMSYELKENGRFSVTVNHELSKDGMQVFVNKWCMKNFGRLPEVSADVLRA